MSEMLLIASGGDVGKSLQLLNSSERTWMFLERIPRSCLTEVERQEGIRLVAYESTTDWSQWERGRVFCAEWELCWEGTSLVYTGGPAPALLTAGFVASDRLNDANAPQTASYYLWGRRAGAYFAEGSIPRRLQYPVVGGSRVRLRVLQWFGVRGEPIAWRASELETVP